MSLIFLMIPFVPLLCTRRIPAVSLPMQGQFVSSPTCYAVGRNLESLTSPVCFPLSQASSEPTLSHHVGPPLRPPSYRSRTAPALLPVQTGLVRVAAPRPRAGHGPICASRSFARSSSSPSRWRALTSAPRQVRATTTYRFCNGFGSLSHPVLAQPLVACKSSSVSHPSSAFLPLLSSPLPTFPSSRTRARGSRG